MTTTKETLLQPAMIEKLERLGYYLLPRTHATSPGYPGLLLLLRKHPHPEAVSDPESVRLRLQSRDGSVHWTTIDAHTPPSRTRTVSPTPIHIREHDGTESAFFTFGGTLAAEELATGVAYALSSSAPVLCLSEDETRFGSHLAGEVEAILAQKQTQSDLDDATFLRQLLDVEPDQLYTTLLKAVLDHYQRTPALKRGNVAFYRALQREKRWLAAAGQWPPAADSLSEFLSRP